jgi:hypothetical protein
LSPKKTEETVWAFGHPNISAIHPTTLMFSKDLHVSKSGDCIVAVSADKSTKDFSKKFKNALREPNARLSVLIEAGNLKEKIQASGSTNLILTHPTDIVIRKSGYICNRTIAIYADKASSDISRELVKKLKEPQQKIKVTITVEV